MRLFKTQVREVFDLVKNMYVLLPFVVIFSPQNLHMRVPSDKFKHPTCELETFSNSNTVIAFTALHHDHTFCPRFEF